MIVHSGFRGLRVDGRFDRVLEPGRCELPRRRFPGRRVPRVAIVPIDLRERELSTATVSTPSDGRPRPPGPGHGYQRCAMSTAIRLCVPGPASRTTRNGRRARTPAAKVV
ncbi:hypothetical protein KRMM14A1004_35690 [Krasilnikovia sp. MM14-A1004]